MVGDKRALKQPAAPGSQSTQGFTQQPSSLGARKAPQGEGRSPSQTRGCGGKVGSKYSVWAGVLALRDRKSQDKIPVLFRLANLPVSLCS